MAQMKDSGVKWIGEIPSHWEVKMIKHVFNNMDYLRQPIAAEQRQKTNPQYDYYGASGVIDKIDYYNVDDTVLLIGEDGANLLMRNLPLIYKASGKIWVNNHAHILKPNVDNYSYLAHLLESVDYTRYITGSAQPKLSQSNLSAVKICIPTLPEQQNIASFLDKKCGEIDSLIALQEEMIRELQAFKISYILKVVTKGIHKQNNYKESYVDWIGRIPETWSIAKFKNLFKVKKVIAGQLGYDVLSVTQKGIKIKDLSKNEGQLAQDYSKYQIVNVGDFVMNHMDLLTGFVDLSVYNGVTSPDYRTFRSKNEKMIDNHYYLKIFQICYWTRLFYNLGQGVSTLGRWRLPIEQQNNFMLPLPPINEQKDIAVHLDTKIFQIDSLIELKQQKIAELKDYKKSIIYEYVTGKKRV